MLYYKILFYKYFMGFDLFKKEEKKEDENIALFSRQISDVSRRLMLLESRIKAISDKQNELSKTIFEQTNSLEKQLAVLTEQAKLNRSKTNILEQKQNYLEKYLHILAPKTDMMVLRAKINLLNPMYLISKEEIKMMINEKIANQEKIDAHQQTKSE